MRDANGLTVVLSKVIGWALPIIANRFKLDPAIMVSPLITTIVDAVALITYFFYGFMVNRIIVFYLKE